MECVKKVDVVMKKVKVQLNMEIILVVFKIALMFLLHVLFSSMGHINK